MTQHVTRPKPEKNRLRRTMMFMNAQKPGLIKDAYIYGADTIMLDLEAVSYTHLDVYKRQAQAASTVKEA